MMTARLHGNPRHLGPFIDVLRAAGWDGNIVIAPTKPTTRQCPTCGHQLEVAS